MMHLEQRTPSCRGKAFTWMGERRRRNAPANWCIGIAFLCIVAATPCRGQTDPLPYASIANPFPDTLDQLYRDSANLKIGRIRLNQAGYRPGDEKLFYYIGTSAAAFSVINTETGATVGNGTLSSTAQQTSGQLDMKCFFKASLFPGGAVKYNLVSPSVSGTVFKGIIPELPPGSYKVVVGADTSLPFVINAAVYNMVRDALLKYYGVARCGSSDSWFHPPCHLKDPVPGGWHDAGDHIKVPQSMGYALSVLGLCAAALGDRDNDHYAKNQARTIATDGIPDVLCEAKVGTDYLLTSYNLGGSTVAGMKTDIGGFGSDHMYWGRPETQDAAPAAMGGPPRPAVFGIGGNTAGTFCAGLAFVGKLYQSYDPAYAANCIKVAQEIYAFGKANPPPYANSAMQSGGMTYDELALGAVALWWATKDTMYKNDLMYSKAIGPNGNADLYTKGGFAGGWFCRTNPGPQKTYANTCWDNLEVYALWGLYRLILIDQATASSYGINAAERLRLIENILYCQIVDIADVSVGTSTIDLPPSSFQWKGSTLKSDNLWGWMKIQDERWMPNRYQAGNITELFCYYDVASAMQGTALPSSPATTDWKVSEVKSLLLKQLNYMLGCNPWDVSMIVGVGDKNLNHPHHRASNPELSNIAGGFYQYRPPVGALSGGYVPTIPLYAEAMGGSDGYYHTEISLDATTAIFLPIMGMAKQETRGPPEATVRVVSVGCDQAVVEVRQSPFGNATILYGSGAVPNLTASSDSAGVFHAIFLTGLTKGTKYVFNVTVTDMAGNKSLITDFDKDLKPIFFTFTTDANCPGNATFSNVKVCKVTSDSAEIFWFTPNGEFDSKVTYGQAKPPATVKSGDVAGHPVNFHYVKIGGLKEQTTYYFSVQSGPSVDDNGGKYYSFTTPVEYVNFDIRALKYTWSGMTALGMNIINQDSKAFDSLDIRLYFRAKDGFENDLAARMDIGIVYSEAGFQEVFSENGDIQAAISSQKPMKMADTYNAADGTYAYYLSIPLWGVMMKSNSRIRLDILFDSRSPWPPYEALMNFPPKHVITNADWSFGTHSKALGDPADFGGIPEKTKDDVDANYMSLEVDRYICVYRKGEFVWGYSPSRAEQATKRTTYDLVSQITSPLSNPNQDYLRLENASTTLTVRGWATITENGVINDVWVNGKQVKDISSVAKYNTATQRWDLAVPVTLVPGSNPIDITVFGGPEQACAECYGCDFGNHHFYIEYIVAERYPSTLALKDTLGKPLPATVDIDATVFTATVSDKNGNKSATARDTLRVRVFNPMLGDSLTLACIETEVASGVFESERVRVSGKVPAQTGSFEIAMAGGDTVFVLYVDPTDPADLSMARLTTTASFAVPQYGFFRDINGDGRVDQCQTIFSIPLTKAPDSLRLIFSVPGIQTTLNTPAAFTIQANTLTGTITPPFNSPLTGFASIEDPRGMVWMTVPGRTLPAYTFPLYDSAGPVLKSAAFFENEGAGENLLRLSFSEAIDTNSLAGTTLQLIRFGTNMPVALQVRKVSALRPDSGIIVAVTLPAAVTIGLGDSLKLSWAPVGSTIRDLHANMPHIQNPPIPLVMIPAPPAIKSARYIDADGDGRIDSIYVTGTRSVAVGQIRACTFDWNGSTHTVSVAAIKKVADSTIVAYVGQEVAQTGPITTSGAMQVSILFDNQLRLAGAVDNAGPVLIAATYSPGRATGASRQDTLDVVFSEAITAPQSLRPFVFVRPIGPQLYRMTLTLLSQNGASARFAVSGFEPVSIENPVPGDSLWIDPAALVMDISGVLQLHPANHRVALEIKIPPAQWEVLAGPNPFVPGVSTTGTFARGTGFSPMGCLIIVKTSFLLPDRATVKIYDALGTLIKEGAMVKSQGALVLVWDGTNMHQRFVGSGSYCAVVHLFDAEREVEARKIIVGVVRNAGQ
jgi:hypothetical protein